MSSAESVSAEVKAFLKRQSDAELTDSGKVRCTVTGHEMPARLEALEQHFSGKRYKNAKERSQYSFAQHEPHIVPHKKNPHLLYCMLTKQPVSKQTKAVENHVNGKKYKRLLAEALNPTKKVTKKREREEVKGRGGDGGGESDDEEELEDVENLSDLEEEDGDKDGDNDGVVLEDDDDAAEFLEEGPFWERDGDGEEDEDEDDELDESDEEELGGGDEVKQEEARAGSERFTRPKIAVAAGKGNDVDELGSASAPPPEAKRSGAKKQKDAKHSKPKKTGGTKERALPATASPNLASVKPKDKTRMPPPMSLHDEASKRGAHESKKRKGGQPLKG